MAEAARCSRCGAALTTGGAQGASCPRCLLALGLSEGLGGAESGPAPADPEAPPADLPDRIGPFRILDKVGAGDRSVVYLAERAQRVALKVVRLEPDSPDVLGRLEAERPALDRVSHPGLARVLDAGTTEDGRSWFATEWVTGVPITEYCDRERLAVRHRLALVIEVCEAIQHAHAEGVVHGDIKPSNVLVTEEDEGPRPKILNLGLARALDQRFTAELLYTARGLLSGPPCYVPPERTCPEASDSRDERAWSERILPRALARLREEMAETEGAKHFEQLKGHLTGDEAAESYASLAEAWGVGESAVRVAVHRLRKRLGRLLREEISATVNDPADVGEELRHLDKIAAMETGGSAPGVRTDVYSLGVLLYELLVGAPPFDARRLRQVGWREMVRVIREEPPARLSARVAAFDQTRASEVAAQRRTEPRRLGSELRDGLDWIVLEALQKDPSQRYPSVHALALDLQHHLRGEPLSVGPPGLWGRVIQAVRRARRRAS